MNVKKVYFLVVVLITIVCIPLVFSRMKDNCIRKNGEVVMTDDITCEYDEFGQLWKIMCVTFPSGDDHKCCCENEL